MVLQVEKDDEGFAAAGACRLAVYIRQNPGRLLCLAAGDTPLGMYRALIELQRQGQVDLNTVFYAGLDEWVGLGPETKGACLQVMTEGFFGPAGIQAQRVRMFDGLADPGRECDAMARWVAGKGGIGLTLLGIGMNGHVGFNEPGADTGAQTLVVDLDPITQAVGKKYFSGGPCPTQGMTLGLALLRAAGAVILAAKGPQKGRILRQALAQDPCAQVPASLFQTHPDLLVVTDEAAFRGMI
jgi:6-phosphogluconolactonase/glucosamine-6-phosphate isomerase/deaminase